MVWFDGCALPHVPMNFKLIVVMYLWIIKWSEIWNRHANYIMTEQPSSTRQFHPSLHEVDLNHSMMTSSNGNIFRVTGPLCGEFTGPGGFPTQRPVTQSFDVWFDLRLNKRLSKQPWGWWFEPPSWSLWHHRNVRCLRLPCTTRTIQRRYGRRFLSYRQLFSISFIKIIAILLVTCIPTYIQNIFLLKPNTLHNLINC